MQLLSIQNKIYEARDTKIMLDFDLATLYEVETRVLNQAIKRNIDSFPEDFMFRLTKDEWENMSSQIVMNSSSQIVMMDLPKNRTGRYLPYAFTEHGVTMLASVLKSSKARQMNIAIVRAFVTLRKAILDLKIFQEQLKELEVKYDKQFADIFQVIHFLIAEKEKMNQQKNRNQIGYKK